MTPKSKENKQESSDRLSVSYKKLEEKLVSQADLSLALSPANEFSLEVCVGLLFFFNPTQAHSQRNSDKSHLFPEEFWLISPAPAFIIFVCTHLQYFLMNLLGPISQKYE